MACASSCVSLKVRLCGSWCSSIRIVRIVEMGCCVRRKLCFGVFYPKQSANLKPQFQEDVFQNAGWVGAICCLPRFISHCTLYSHNTNAFGVSEDASQKRFTNQRISTGPFEYIRSEASGVGLVFPMILFSCSIRMMLTLCRLSRTSPSECILFVTSGDGYGVAEMMQRSATFALPLDPCLIQARSCEESYSRNTHVRNSGHHLRSINNPPGSNPEKHGASNNPWTRPTVQTVSFGLFDYIFQLFLHDFARPSRSKP